MTLRDLISKVQAAEPNAVAKIREALSASDDIREYTVYVPQENSRWASLVKEILGVSIKDMQTVGVTAYSTGSEFFQALEGVLKQEYDVVCSIAADDMGWRHIYVCGSGEDDPKPTIVCANYYEASREEVKSMYGDASETNTAADTEAEAEGEPEEIDLDDIDPFE